MSAKKPKEEALLTINELAVQLQAYRKTLNMSDQKFIDAIRISRRTWLRIKNGESISTTIINRLAGVLKAKTIKPFDMEAANRAREKPSPFDLGQSDRETTALVVSLAEGYKNRLNSYARTANNMSTVRRDYDSIIYILDQMLSKGSSVPLPRQCMLLGLAQGYLIKAGVITVVEALEDQNSVYYAPL